LTGKAVAFTSVGDPWQFGAERIFD
jgi:hypothetical protein